MPVHRFTPTTGVVTMCLQGPAHLPILIRRPVTVPGRSGTHARSRFRSESTTMAESTFLSQNSDLDIAARTIGATSVLDLLRSRGYVIFDHLMPEDTIDRICEELEPSFAEAEHHQGDLFGRNIRIRSVLQRSPSSRLVAMHMTMLCVANAILGGHCEPLELFLAQGVRLYPGRRRPLPHRYGDAWHGNRRGIASLVNVTWALSDFTAENGAPMLWPRSHFNQWPAHLDPTEPIVAEMRRGSALVYLGSILHCSGSNVSSEPLTGLQFSYCQGSLKQHGNSFESYPPEVTDQFPEILRELLGVYEQRPYPRGSDGHDSEPRLDTDPRAASRAQAIPKATAREIDVSTADEWSDGAAPGTRQ